MASISPLNVSGKKSLKFLLHTFFATGHILPMQAVAQALVRRGHEVVWITSANQEARVKASGSIFVPTQDLAVVDEKLLAADPKSLEDASDALFTGRLSAQVADLRRVLANFPADCLVNDALPQGVAALYDLGEVPFWATLGVVPMYLPIRSSEDTDKNPQFLPKSTLGTILSHPEIFLPCLNQQRAILNLNSLDESDVLNYSPFLHIQASCASLEFQDPAFPRQLSPLPEYVGPLVTAGIYEPRFPYPSWWSDVENSSCVIGITQGTYADDPSSLIIPSIEALAEDSTILLVIPSPHVEKIKKLIQIPNSGNIRLASWIPYDLLLPRCSLLITNGGYGSVTQALSHGIPVVCAGTTEDKKDTAARVTWLGAGIDLGTDTPSVDQIREAVHDILGSRVYRERAIDVAQQLQGLGGAERACTLLEEAVARHVGNHAAKILVSNH